MPANRATAKKTTTKKSTARKVTKKKKPARKVTARKITGKTNPRKTTSKTTSKTRAKTTAYKAMAKKPIARKATARKTSARKVVAKKTAKKATARRATASRSTPVPSQAKRPARRGARPSGQTATPGARISATTMPVKRGDIIVIDSPKVGSQPREGEVLQVVHGDLSVSYRVKWSDGNETLISPALGSARFVRA